MTAPFLLASLLVATPFAAIGFATVAALVYLYRFRKRSAPRVVPSLLLWPEPTSLDASSKRHERFRFPPSFFLELAVLAALVFAALTPLVMRPETGLLVVVRDISPSMQAVGSDGQSSAQRADRVIDEERRARGKGAVAVREADTDEKIDAIAAKFRSADVLVVSDRPPPGPLPS